MKLLRGQLLLALGASIWLGGCASIGPPVAPSLELPRAPSDLHAARKGEKVTLTWTIPARTTDRQSVRYLGATRVCRSLDPTLKQCQIPVGDAPPPADFASARKSQAQKLTATFTDTLPSAIGQEHPTVSATYAVEVLNTAGRSAGISNQVHVPLVPTLPPFGGFSAQPTAQGVLISWQCPPVPGRGRADTKYLFRIYRHSESSPSATRIAELDATECAAAPGGLVPLSSQPSSADTSVPKEEDKSITSFLDQTFEWENTYFYRGAVVSVIKTPGTPAVEVEGDDTPEVKVFAHDIFPPAVPSGLQAVFSGPGQQPFIDLIWAPVPDADLAGYNIYRREEGTGWEKLNTEPVRMPAYRDTNVVSGKNYAYSIAAVDVRGNESGRSEEASESVP
jgi:hypothetical protein